MAEKGRREGRKITYDAIHAQTGVSKTALTRLANGRSNRVDTSVMSRLCAYFSCQPGELFVYVPDSD